MYLKRLSPCITIFLLCGLGFAEEFFNHAMVSQYQHKLSIAEERIGSLKIELNDRRSAILRTEIGVYRAGSEGDIHSLLDAYDRLYRLCHEEYEELGRSTLFKISRWDYTGIPKIIAGICSRSDQLAPETKFEILTKQDERSNHMDVARALINVLSDWKSYEDAIQFAEKEYDKSKTKYGILAVQLRTEYQIQLIESALDQRGIEDWQPNVIDHDQLRMAIQEAERLVEKDPSNVRELFSIFESVRGRIPINDKVQSFYQKCLRLLQSEGPRHDNLISELSQRVTMTNPR